MEKTGATFRRWGMATVIAVYLLILVGGIVRASGAGMGCPDWPKCFGMWIPPTSEVELPPNYKEIFGAKLKGEVVFNPTKTWIEYINRLLGVLIGFFILGTFVLSVSNYWKSDRVIVALSFLTFLLVVFEGWLGSIVVSTELHPGMITIHMLVSIIIVALLLYVVLRSYDKHLSIEAVGDKRAISFFVGILALISTGQVLMGTQVRESVDELTRVGGGIIGENWLSDIGGKFYAHIVLSVIILVAHIYLLKIIKSKLASKQLLYKLTSLLLWVVSIEIISGSLMALLRIPAYAQPVHLLFGVAILGIQFSLFLLLNREYITSVAYAKI